MFVPTFGWVMDAADRQSLESRLLVYGGQRINTYRKRFGLDSPEYKQAVERWSAMYKLHLQGWDSDHPTTTTTPSLTRSAA